MATATLELVNPYSKLGLKRRPTYNEIINLIDENETITGNLPDRTATLYKASPEGSFFDGTDAMELLKEQQNRIFQRQIQDLLLRQNVRNNGRTFNLERHLQSANTTEVHNRQKFNQIEICCQHRFKQTYKEDSNNYKTDNNKQDKHTQEHSYKGQSSTTSTLDSCHRSGV